MNLGGKTRGIYSNPEKIGIAQHDHHIIFHQNLRMTHVLRTSFPSTKSESFPRIPG